MAARGDFTSFGGAMSQFEPEPARGPGNFFSAAASAKGEETPSEQGGQELLQLVVAARTGQEVAVAVLVENFGPMLWNFFLHQCRNRELAEDHYQETWLRILQHLGQLQALDRFRSWAFSIAYNVLRARCRRTEPDGVDFLDELPHPAGDPADFAIASERRRALYSALGGLGELDRQILILDSLLGLPQQEIAEMFQENLNTVKTKLRRAKIRLARLLTEAGHG
jgi:RNA polymerase sigma-70 factor (ECF subfamily)